MTSSSNPKVPLEKSTDTGAKTREEFVAEMDARYERMLAGHETEHALIEE